MELARETKGQVAINALLKAQEAFEGVAEELGIQSEEDVVKLVKEIRAESGSQYKCE